MTRIQWPSTHRSMETCKVLIRDRRNCVFTLVRNIFVNDDISSVQLDSIPPVSCVWNQHVYSFVLSAMRSTTVWMCVCLIVCSQRQYILWSVTGRCFIDAPRINRKEKKTHKNEAFFKICSDQCDQHNIHWHSASLDPHSVRSLCLNSILFLAWIYSIWLSQGLQYILVAVQLNPAVFCHKQTERIPLAITPKFK